MPLARRVMEAFGGNKTVDEKFDGLEAKLANLERKVKGFNKIVGSYMKDLKNFQDTSLSGAVNLLSYYEDNPGMPMHALLGKMKDFHQDNVETKYPLLVKTVDERVSKALDEFTKELGQVRARVKVRNEARLSFDHYRVKIDGLRKEREKYVSQGNLAAWKNKEKFKRNEEKFEASKLRYDTLNAAVMKEMQKLYNKRFTHINNFTSSFVKMQMFFWSAYGKQCSSFLGPMKAALQRSSAMTTGMASGQSPAPVQEHKAMEPPTQARQPDQAAMMPPSSPPSRPLEMKNEPPSLPSRSPPKAKPKKKKKKKKSVVAATADPGYGAYSQAAPPMSGGASMAQPPGGPATSGGNVFDDFEF
mmetsp:Transcript_13906/g.26356  ORF Transcript_13906/g.26356 Transcript_13906/m.26356 type:complete len:359 (-) Transcript_13906:286-1362(-)|eukprot:CAMPEP_0167783450 /NCGR_PEP_ID=MMETSP0111_2-20121227/7078_1 /TAXON_ID=91324 /ORGANISM="Lotharella globosa, Strain CCCM811" /LENGTH=358 /DNA_ID=CAMNT_0007674391 /DNA_START=111 /DNA_END=1187 /DNA_ORIENTATION=-